MARAADVGVEMLMTLGMPKALVGSAGAKVSLYGAEKEYTCVSLPGAATTHLRSRQATSWASTLKTNTLGYRTTHSPSFSLFS